MTTPAVDPPPTPPSSPPPGPAQVSDHADAEAGAPLASPIPPTSGAADLSEPKSYVPPPPGPLPGEFGHKPVDDSIALAPRGPAGVPPPRKSAGPASTPKLAAKPLWPVPEEPKGRRFLAVMVMLVVVGLYAWMLFTFYAGAHGGVDQAGYLMTARLIDGEYNIDSPRTVARPTTDKPTVSVDKAPANWTGGAAGYVAEVHPKPASIQSSPSWDWLRNRISYVPSSPFEFASRMCIITEPYGPASPDLPGAGGAGGKPVVEGKPAEYRVYAKYPFGFSLLAATGRVVDGWFDKQVSIVPLRRAAALPAASGPERAGTAPASAPGTTSAPASAPVAAPVPAATTSARARIQAASTSFERVGRGIDGMYFINPLCTVLACFFAYFMFRQAVSSFMAIIGVIWLACNPLVLVYSNDANSHASSLFCVCAGFWGLLSFLRTQQMWRAWIGGLALGYCCTIRYSEFLLVLPVAFAASVHFRFTWRRFFGSLSLLAAWAIPVMALAFVCWIAFGSPTKTGYTYCNEDTGFGWKYLTGNWEDRQLTGNWETLVTQINRTGLFLLWPLALAGLLGMVGSTWRLGCTIALWVIPSMCLYMLYYWAPGGDTTTGYLRFYVTVMPGLIFAGVWLLDRALSFVPGDKYAGLAIGTLLTVVLLLAVAFFADGGPDVIDGGLGKTIGGFVTQAPAALWHLVSQSVFGLLCAFLIVAAGAGMWMFDRELIAARLGVALGAGAITALGCAINLETIMPSVERNYQNQTALRVTVDNLREALPRGTVIICDDSMLQQLDCIGGWKLYNASAFLPTLYNQSMTKLAQRNTPERMDDPDPLQSERSQFYKELLTKSSTVDASISLGVRSLADLQGLERAVIDKNLELGHRVTFLVLTDPGDAGMTGGGAGGFGAGGRVQIPDGYETRAIRKWTVSAPPSGPVTQGAAAAFGAAPGRGGRGGRGGAGGGGGRGNNGAGVGALLGGAPAGAAAPNAPLRQGPTYTLFEVKRRGG